VPATIEGLQSGLLSMIVDNAELKEMGLNLANYVANKYMWESLINEYMNLYKGILKKEKGH
jgi:glycosyltransferase involved in cell wall biosynthesis